MQRSTLVIVGLMVGWLVGAVFLLLPIPEGSFQLLHWDDWKSLHQGAQQRADELEQSTARAKLWKKDLEQRVSHLDQWSYSPPGPAHASLIRNLEKTAEFDAPISDDRYTEHLAFSRVLELYARPLTTLRAVALPPAVLGSSKKPTTRPAADDTDLMVRLDLALRQVEPRALALCRGTSDGNAASDSLTSTAKEIVHGQATACLRLIQWLQTPQAFSSEKKASKQVVAAALADATADHWRLGQLLEFQRSQAKGIGLILDRQAWVQKLLLYLFAPVLLYSIYSFLPLLLGKDGDSTVAPVRMSTGTALVPMLIALVVVAALALGHAASQSEDSTPNLRLLFGLALLVLGLCLLMVPSPRADGASLWSIGLERHWGGIGSGQGGWSMTAGTVKEARRLLAALIAITIGAGLTWPRSGSAPGAPSAEIKPTTSVAALEAEPLAPSASAPASATVSPAASPAAALQSSTPSNDEPGN